MNKEDTGIEQSYEELNMEYLKSGLSYKSNEILHKIADDNTRYYPYLILLHIVKFFHFNQFEVIFFSHILKEVQPIFLAEPQLITTEQRVSQSIEQKLHKIFQYSLHSSNLIQDQNEQQNMHINDYQHNIPQLKKLYLNLVVLGYAVKYYLNDNGIKSYENQIRNHIPDFFDKIFNIWVNKHGSTVLSTTPKKINSYYKDINLHQDLDDCPINVQQCQYRNYNQIVQQLLKNLKETEQCVKKQIDSV